MLSRESSHPLRTAEPLTAPLERVSRAPSAAGSLEGGRGFGTSHETHRTDEVQSAVLLAHRNHRLVSKGLASLTTSSALEPNHRSSF